MNDIRLRVLVSNISEKEVVKLIENIDVYDFVPFDFWFEVIYQAIQPNCQIHSLWYSLSFCKRWFYATGTVIMMFSRTTL